jgi:hypothetical protein
MDRAGSVTFEFSTLGTFDSLQCRNWTPKYLALVLSIIDTGMPKETSQH